MGTHCEKKSKGNKRTQKSQHTRNNWKRKEKKKQKNKAPDSQTSQATCQTKEIDRAHRSHSTREAKKYKTNKKNQGSPIKTIKSHDSILIPLLGRGVFTAGFAPTRPSTNYDTIPLCLKIRERRMTMQLVVYGARQCGIKEYPSWASWGSLLLKIETRS